MRKTALLVVPLCLATAVGCGGKSHAQKVAEGAAKAKAACEVFHNFHPPAGTDPQSQINATKATYGAFLEAADLSSQAEADDSRWQSLASAAAREAAAFQIIVKATQGSKTLDRAAVGNAVNETKVARPLFLSACMQADPKVFTPSAVSPSPAATQGTTPTNTPTKRKSH